MPATWLDRAIGFVAPAAGRRRLRDRHAFEATLRAYAGADSGRRSAGWSPRGTVAAKLLAGSAGLVLDDKHLPTPLEMEPVAAFLIGVVGMIACQAAINAVTAVRDKADDFVEREVTQDHTPPV